MIICNVFTQHRMVICKEVLRGFLFRAEGATHGAPTFPQQAVNQMKLDAAAQYWVRSNNHTHADDDM